MMDYKKVCANCLVQANRVVGLWEGIYERSLNFGDDITNPYDTMPLDDLDGGCKQINEICHEIDIKINYLSVNFYYDCIDKFFGASRNLIHAFCEIIGEPFDEKYLAYDEQTFWRLNPISGKYAFTLLEMWWVVSEYDKWLEKCESRENVGLVVKSWYNSIYRDKINLLHRLMWTEGVLDTTK